MKSKLENFSIDDLIELSREIRDLIEDNNQNIKDCHKILKSIEKHIIPNRPSKLKSIFFSIINKLK